MSPFGYFTQTVAGRRGWWSKRLAMVMLAVAAACAALPAGAVDANLASAEELQAVRGIGPKTALLIVRERERGGAFESISDLSDRVRGIGPKRARAMQANGLSVVVRPLASGTPVPARNAGVQEKRAR